MSLTIDQYLIGRARNFSYLISSDGESLIVDPQLDLAPWSARMEELGSKLTGILLTHTHWDHIIGVPNVLKKFGALPIFLHRADAHRIQAEHPEIAPHCRFVKQDDRIPIGASAIEVWHTPGHSAGECCFLINEGGKHHLFTGDTVFVGDIGRTDLETGSNEEMFETLQRIKALPADTIIYPGHDYGRTPTSTIAQERANSAAFQCKTIEELRALP